LRLILRYSKKVTLVTVETVKRKVLRHLR